MKRVSLVLLFAVVLDGLLCVCDSHAAKKRPPNIVFFLVDDLGWNDTAPYGNTFHETPNVTRLAKQGMKFSNAYAACPVCSPTRASIMSGKYPATLHLTDFIPGHFRPYEKLLVPDMKMQLDLKEISLAECVKPAGYVTASFGKWHLGGSTHNPDAQGFDDWVVTGGRHFAPKFRTTPKTPVKKGEYLGDFLTRQAERFMEENRDKPFMLYLPHYAVHIPLEAKKELVAKYEKKQKLPAHQSKATIRVDWTGASIDDIEEMIKKPILARLTQPKAGNPMIKIDSVMIRGLLRITLDFKPGMTGEEIEKFVETRLANVKDLPASAGRPSFRLNPVNHPTYAAMVEHIDQSLGRIMKKLDDLKLADNTVLVFFSDNGGLYRRFDEKGPAVMSNYPLRDEKGSMYEGGIREPCIIRWPGVVKPGSECDVPISSVDFWPTIAEIVGTTSKFQHKVDGISLLPLLKQSDRLKVDRALYWHYPHYHHTAPVGAIRYGDYKLLEYFEDGKLELYNLAKDIGETHNLAKSHSKQTQQLLAMLKAWRKDINAQMPRANPNFDPKRREIWQRRPRPKQKTPRNKPRAQATGSQRR